MEKHPFEIRVEPRGKNCSIKVDGHELPNVRSLTVKCDVSAASRVNVEMYALKPFTINGKGEIVVDTVVVHEGIARQVYENLKKIFEEDES